MGWDLTRCQISLWERVHPDDQEHGCIASLVSLILGCQISAHVQKLDVRAHFTCLVGGRWSIIITYYTLFNKQLYTCKEFRPWSTPQKNGNTARHWPFPTGHHCSIHRFCPDDRFHSRASVGLPVAALPKSLQAQQHSPAITTGRLQLWAFSQVSVGLCGIWSVTLNMGISITPYKKVAINSRLKSCTLRRRHLSELKTSDQRVPAWSGSIERYWKDLPRNIKSIKSLASYLCKPPGL